MVTRGDGSGTTRLQDSGGCKHETDSRRLPGVALAHRWRVGHHALRDSADYGDRRRREELCRRCEKKDLWFFPSGIPHSIQGLNPDGCEFMLVFDDGEFSESETVLLSDAMAHLPPEVLAKD